MGVKVGLTGSGVVAVAGLLLLAYLGSRAAAPVAAVGAVLEDAAQAVGDALAGVGEAMREAAASPGGLPGAAVGAVGQVVGLPTPSQTTTDPRVARWMIDNLGMYEASRWAGAPALFGALMLSSAEGIPPSPASAAGMALGVTAADVRRITGG